MTVSQSTTPVHFQDLDESLQTLLGTTATSIARETKFVQRKSKITGAHFAQALIFGWLADPNASYTVLQQMLAIAGCDASAQALEQRMTEEAQISFLLSFTS